MVSAPSGKNLGLCHALHKLRDFSGEGVTCKIRSRIGLQSFFLLIFQSPVNVLCLELDACAFRNLAAKNIHTYMHACVPTYLPNYLPSQPPTYLLNYLPSHPTHPTTDLPTVTYPPSDRSHMQTYTKASKTSTSLVPAMASTSPPVVIVTGWSGAGTNPIGFRFAWFRFWNLVYDSTVCGLVFWE